MNIVIHIERLVLDGLPLGMQEALLVRAAVEAELSRLSMRGLSSRELHGTEALSGVKPANIALNSNDRPEKMGQEIGRAVYSRLWTNDARPTGQRGPRNLREKSL